MPDQQAEDTVGKAGQGANWFVGLSGAAVGGALAKLELVERFPGPAKVCFVLAALLFLCSVVAGIYYFFQLLRTSQAKEKANLEKAKDPQDAAALKAAIEERDAENKKLTQFHYGAMLTFPAACLVTWICLICVLLWGLAPAEPSPNRYTVIDAAVHENAQTQQDYTFLVDQQSGALWLMEPQPDKTIEFKEVKRQQLDGKPEVEGAATAAKP